jgi:hypothetical protein
MWLIFQGEIYDEINGIYMSTAFEEALGGTCLAPAWVGIESISAGNPVVTMIFPKRNEYGIDFAQIKRALRDDSVILDFSSADERESFTFLLNKSDVASHSVRPKRRPVAPIIKA